MQDIDPKAKDRAAKLIRDARKNTYGGATKRALKSVQNFYYSAKKSRAGWKESRSLSGMGAETVIRSAMTYGGFAAGTALATAIGSATVIASVASLGIVPAIAGLAGFIGKKGISEFKYQKSARKIKKAVKNGGNLKPDLVVPAMLKVVRKYDRVKIRAYQLGGKWYQRGWSKFAHPLVNRKGKKLRGKHSSVLVKDTLLDERLLELRYYSQLLFNTVGGMIEGAIKAREQYADLMNALFLYTIRQVHFSGNHQSCKPGRCYGISEADFKAKIDLIVNSNTPLKLSQHQLKQFQKSQSDQYHTKKGQEAEVVLKRLQHIADEGEFKYRKEDLEAINKKKSNRSKRKLQNKIYNKQMEDGVLSSKYELGAYGGLFTGQYYSVKESSSGMIAENSKKMLTKWQGIPVVSKEWLKEGAKNAGKNVNYTVGGFAKPMMIGMDVALDEMMRLVKNRLTRRRIMKTKEGALGLLEIARDAEAEASNELVQLCKDKKKSFRTHSIRVAQKVIHYYEKLAELDKNAKDLVDIMKRWKKSDSPFDSCEQAWIYNNVMQTVFRNYNKFITHLVFLEGLLLSLDGKVAERVHGLKRGSIVHEGSQAIKPTHLAIRHKDDDYQDYGKEPDDLVELKPVKSKGIFDVDDDDSDDEDDDDDL